jgi:hypothetical protein
MPYYWIHIKLVKNLFICVLISRFKSSEKRWQHFSSLEGGNISSKTKMWMGKYLKKSCSIELWSFFKFVSQNMLRGFCRGEKWWCGSVSHFNYEMQRLAAMWHRIEELTKNIGWFRERARPHVTCASKTGIMPGLCQQHTCSFWEKWKLHNFGNNYPKLMIQVANWSLWSVLFVYAIKQIFHFWHIIPILLTPVTTMAVPHFQSLEMWIKF